MKALYKTLAGLFTICFLQLIFVSIALACMCPSGNSVGFEFNRSSHVIIAKLEPFELVKINLEENKTEIDLSKYKPLPKLKVQKVFKGNLQAGEILEFDGVYRCSSHFAEVGKEYLLYLGEKPEQGELWQAPACSQSGLLENRLADLLYIKKERKVRNKTRLAGRLFLDKVAISRKEITQIPSLADRKVYIVGENGRFEAKTDQNGVYEIYDLPAGTYKIFSENISGWTSGVSNYDSDVVEIEKSGQYERDFKYKTIDSNSEIFVGIGKLSAKACSD